MKNTIKGRIVGTDTTIMSHSGKVYGYIIVEDETDREHIRMKVDANTDYNVIERGACVDAKMVQLGDTTILRAVELCGC